MGFHKIDPYYLAIILYKVTDLDKFIKRYLDALDAGVDCQEALNIALRNMKNEA